MIAGRSFARVTKRHPVRQDRGDPSLAASQSAATGHLVVFIRRDFDDPIANYIPVLPARGILLRILNPSLSLSPFAVRGDLSGSRWDSRRAET